MKFKRILKSREYSKTPPKVAVHPHAIVTTPYDMVINQMLENFREKNRHGSCGVDINETIERSVYPKFQLTVKDLSDPKKLKTTLIQIRDEWLEPRLSKLIQRKLTQDEIDLIFSPEIFEHFLDDIHIFFTYCDMAEYDYFKKWDNLIFEGAQGLLLDQGHQNFPHVTRSSTGIQNVSAIASSNNINHLEVHYV